MKMVITANGGLPNTYRQRIAKPNGRLSFVGLQLLEKNAGTLAQKLGQWVVSLNHDPLP